MQTTRLRADAPWLLLSAAAVLAMAAVAAPRQPLREIRAAVAGARLQVHSTSRDAEFRGRAAHTGNPDRPSDQPRSPTGVP